MRIPILLLSVLVAAGNLAFSTDGAQAKDTVYTLTKTNVKTACKGRMQSGNGQFGCSRCDAGVCRDFNCSDGTHGVPKGCKEVIIERRKPSAGAIHSTSAGTKNKRVTTSKPGRHLRTNAVYRHRSTGPTNPNGPGGSTGPFAPPNHRRTNHGGSNAKPAMHVTEHHTDFHRSEGKKY
jgi:hypothetical protein